jgi:hypothetical protein
MEEGDGIEPCTFRYPQFSRLLEEPTSAPSIENRPYPCRIKLLDQHLNW